MNNSTNRTLLLVFGSIICVVGFFAGLPFIVIGLLMMYGSEVMYSRALLKQLEISKTFLKDEDKECPSKGEHIQN